MKVSFNGSMGEYCSRSCRALPAGDSCSRLDRHVGCSPIGVIVIGITGASRCGKGWVSEELRKKFAIGPSSVVGQDSFFMKTVKVTTPDGAVVRSAEEPECQDHAAFAQAIQCAMQNALSLPYCNQSCNRVVYPSYPSCCRTCAKSNGAVHEQFCDDRCNGKHPAVIIAEGFKLLHDSQVRSLLTHTFYLELSEDECVRRRGESKDPKLNPNPIAESGVRDVLWPAHERYVRTSVDPILKEGHAQSLAAPSTDEEVQVIIQSICNQMDL